MIENFDELRNRRKFVRQSLWGTFSSLFSPKDHNSEVNKSELPHTDPASRRRRMEEWRQRELAFLRERLDKAKKDSEDGIPSVEVVILDNLFQTLKEYDEAIKDFGKKYKTLREAKTAVSEARKKAREAYFEDKVFREKYEIFLKIQGLQKAIKEFEKAAHQTMLVGGHTYNSEYEQLYKKLRDNIEKIGMELQTLATDNPIEFRSAYLLSLSEDLKKEGHVALVGSVRGYLDKIQTNIINGRPMFLHGPTGTGKTSLAKFAAKELTGKHPEMIYCNPGTKATDIYGKTGLTVEEGASKTFFDFGPLAKAVREGKICIFDEFTSLTEIQMSMIKGVMSAKPGDSVEIPGHGRVKMQPGFQLIFTSNLKSEKNPERSDLPPEIANEFAQNNLEINYTKPIEAYDIFLSRIIDQKGEAEFSRYDLEETVPKLLKAMEAIQDAYNGTMKPETAQVYGLSDLGKVKTLKKLVMNQRTIDDIIRAWKVESKKRKSLSFVEFLDECLATELNFGTYREDKLFAAKILASHGLLRTLDLEQKIGIPPSKLSVSNFQKIKKAEIQASRQREVWNIKQLAEFDPFGIRKQSVIKQIDEALEVVGREKDVGQRESDVPTNELGGFLKGKKTQGEIESERNSLIWQLEHAQRIFYSRPIPLIERYPLIAFDFPSQCGKNKGVGTLIHLDQHTPSDLEGFFRRVKPEIFDPLTDKGFQQWLEKKRKNTKIKGAIKMYEIAEYVARVLSEKYYIPGIDYVKWAMENCGHSNLSHLKPSALYFSSSALFWLDEKNTCRVIALVVDHIGNCKIGSAPLDYEVEDGSPPNIYFLLLPKP